MILTPELDTWLVLVIDDEPDNLRLVADVLEFGGSKVMQASDAKRGLALIDEFHPNLLLLDLAMPDMDGWEMHRILRSRPDTRELLIVALTALAMPGDAERVKAAGFSGYITKPFRVRALITELQELIRTAAPVVPPPPNDPS
jgi:two-component system cell cycle response regulator DivK